VVSISDLEGQYDIDGVSLAPEGIVIGSGTLVQKSDNKQFKILTERKYRYTVFQIM